MALWIKPQYFTAIALRRFLKKNLLRCGPRQCGRTPCLPPAGGGWRGVQCGRGSPPVSSTIWASPLLASPRWGLTITHNFRELGERSKRPVVDNKKGVAGNKF